MNFLIPELMRTFHQALSFDVAIGKIIYIQKNNLKNWFTLLTLGLK